MRPIKIEFQAFGPYADYEVVDFTKVASNGLFLICGKTGTGKTTILDAITFALYGMSSGNGRNDFEAMRCTSADDSKGTFVRFEFENSGTYYLFERRNEKKRKNFSTSYNVMRKNDAGEWEVLLENPREKDLTKLAEEIIGLNYDQFRQVIVLPQGQFETFLTSKNKDEILTNIFGEGKWEKIAANFQKNAKDKQDELNKIKDALLNRLKEEECESISQLEELVSAKECELDKLEQEYKKADYEAVIEAQERLISLAERFDELHKKESDLKQLEDRTGEYNGWIDHVDAADRADKVKNFIDTAAKAKEKLKKRRNEEKTAEEEAEKAKQAFEAAAEKYNKHIAEEPEIKEKEKLKIQYEGKKATYEGLEEAKNDLAEAKSNLKEAENKVKEAKSLCEELGNKVITLHNEFKALDEEHSKMLAGYLAGITGSLAEKLNDGEPCPVCGSTVHPHKAVKADDNVTEDEVKEKKRLVDAKYAELNDASNNKTSADETLGQEIMGSSEINQVVAAAEAVLKSKKESLIEGIDSLETLNIAIKELGEEIENYDKIKKNLEKKKKDTEDEATKKSANIEPAKKESVDAEKDFDIARKAVGNTLEKNGFTSESEARNALLSEEDVNKIKEKINDYKSEKIAVEKRIEELKTELAGAIEPNKAECEETKAATKDAIATFNERTGGLKTEITRLKGKEAELKEKNDGLDEKIQEAKDDLSFANKLRGDTGIGLQRYVLGIMFSSVITAANKMLEMVHGGRYYIYRTDESSQGSNKKGLDLKVYDKNSEEHEGRFVNTLSGGEKFLVSLALSIGMSTVAQKGGMKIEALFIDEGFGSLDEDSIGDAMDILDSIQQANGLVGIISHVQLLQERIPAKLKVLENETGSHIVQTVG